MSILVFILSVISMVSFGYGSVYSYNGYEKCIITNPLMLEISVLTLIAVIVICLIKYKTSVAIFEIGFSLFSIATICLVKNAATDTEIFEIVLKIVFFGISLISLISWLVGINYEETEENPYNKEEKKYEILRVKSKSELSGELKGYTGLLLGQVDGKINTDEVYKIYYYTDDSNTEIRILKSSEEEIRIFPFEEDQKPYLLEKN